MKRYCLLLFALILIAGSSCQKKVDIEKEKQAIMAVVKAESEDARIGNVDGLISCYIQDEYNTRLNVNTDDYNIITGWDKLAPLFKGLSPSTEYDTTKISFTKENAVIKVMGNTAWLICDNDWKYEAPEGETKWGNIQVTFLEKVDGVWKFSFAAWITKPEPKVVTEEPETAK
jgi:ketosteroid isomerase-like protein